MCRITMNGTKREQLCNNIINKGRGSKRATRRANPTAVTRKPRVPKPRPVTSSDATPHPVGNSARKRRDPYCSIVLRTVKKRKRLKEERENQVTRREAKHYEITLGEVETGQARSTLCPLRHHFSNTPTITKSISQPE